MQKQESSALRDPVLLTLCGAETTPKWEKKEIKSTQL